MLKTNLKTLAAALLTAAFTGIAHAQTESQVVPYGKDQFEGYVVRPAKVDKRTPALLIVHNWMGLTDETKYQAERFAKLGYIAFAADIYGKGVRPKDTKEAAELATKYKTDRKLFRQRLNLALDALKKQKYVDASRLAAAGYCFGGTGVIELARSGAPLKGVISFHGGLDSPNPKDGKKIKAELLIHHGALDPFETAEDLAAFQKELNESKVRYRLIKYSGAVHSFTEKGAGHDIKKGAAYNEAADKESFATTEMFLKRIF